MLFLKQSYRVTMRGRSGVVYEEGGKTVNIEAELLTGEIDLVLYFDSIRHWQPPHEREVISQDEKWRIKENVTAALEGKGLSIEWE